MTKTTRLSIPVSQDEVEALRNLARRELRHPRDQARYLLRCALLEGRPPNGGQVTEGEGAQVVVEAASATLWSPIN